MATKKVTVTLPEDVLAAGNELARKAGLPFSTWLARATEHEVRLQDGLAAMRAWEDENGAFSADEIAWADGELAKADAAMRAAEHRRHHGNAA